MLPNIGSENDNFAPPNSSKMCILSCKGILRTNQDRKPKDRMECSKKPLTCNNLNSFFSRKTSKEARQEKHTKKERSRKKKENKERKLRNNRERERERQGGVKRKIGRNQWETLTISTDVHFGRKTGFFVF